MDLQACAWRRCISPLLLNNIEPLAGAGEGAGELMSAMRDMAASRRAAL